MSNRATGFLLWAVPGALLLALGLLLPAHLRAVDSGVLRAAGRKTASLVEQGLLLVKENNLGAAGLLLQAAQHQRVPGQPELASAIKSTAVQHPGWEIWGGGDTGIERLFASDEALPKAASEPFTDFVVREENRVIILELLGTSLQPAVQELIRCRALTNTVLFPPAQSAAGQPLEAALGVCGLLLDRGHLSRALNKTVLKLAADANHGAPPAQLEQVLLDLMSLGQRLNWGQLTEFVGEIQDPETLRLLAALIRKSDTPLPVLFAAVELSNKPGLVAGYCTRFGQTGMGDLATSLRFGTGSVEELLQRNQRVYVSSWRQSLAAQAPLSGVVGGLSTFCWKLPRLAVALKWFLYAAGGFLLAAAAHFGRRPVTPLEEPLQVRGFHVAREVLFALGFLLVVLLLSEPFLAQENQRVEFPLRLRLPTTGMLVPAGAAGVHTAIMKQLSLLTLLLFFVLQALLYTACVFKLAEIRRQRLSPRVKLKLLENEDHLFDAGLYLGFAGTIISLILVSLGVIQPSLMAAYSSTSFGIIFVSGFKIFNLRPVRRRLLLEAEAETPEPLRPAVAPALANPS